MTLTAVTAINCTACGAGLDVLGGGRVTTHICPYCGTELDATDHYRALKRFNDKPRPKTPFPIGTSGKINGVHYTVIGLLEQVEHWNGRSAAWLDHQIYSPTHGYAWLTLERGHCTFTRRYRRPLWLSSTRVALATSRPVIRDNGERLEYYETSTSETTYAEGEFSWRPQREDRTTSVSVLGDTRMLSFSTTGQEHEVEQTTFLSAEAIRDGFGFDPGLNPGWVHPLQPRAFGPNAGFLMKAGGAFAALSLVLAVVLAASPTRDVIKGASLGRHDLPFERNLNDLRAGELVRVNLSGNGINVWSALELELSDPEDEVLFSTTRAIEYYRGRDADGNWSEGNNRARLTFRAPYDGDYTLSVAAEDDEGYRASGGPKPKAWTTLYISATAGHRVWGWMTLASALFLMAAGWPFWQMWRHNERRWRGSDWVDESDD